MSATAPRATLLAAAPLGDRAPTVSASDAAGADAPAATPVAIAPAPATPAAAVNGDVVRPAPAATDGVPQPDATTATAFAADAFPGARTGAGEEAAIASTGQPATAFVLPARPATTAQIAAPSPMPQSPAGVGSIGGALFALVLVVGLILALGWLARRMPGLGGARGNPALRVVGSLALGPRDRVVVVAVGETQLLLGVGPGGTRTLHTLDAPLPLPADARATPAFAQLLAQHFGKKA